MRKTYITSKPNVIYKLTFIKNWFCGEKYVDFKLIRINLDNYLGFQEATRDSGKFNGSLNIKSGKIRDWTDSSRRKLSESEKSFIRKQWLKHKEDFLKSRK